MFAVGNTWLTRGTYDPLDELLQRYRKVTCDDIRRVIETFGLAPHAEVFVGNAE